ncbi:MAG: hypothetical protein ACRC0A_07730 [Chitinophagaceae bacterium]
MNLYSIRNEIYNNLGYNTEDGGGIFPLSTVNRIIYSSIKKFLTYSTIILKADFNEFERFVGLQKIIAILDSAGNKIDKPIYFKQGQNIHFKHPISGTVYYQWNGDDIFLSDKEEEDQSELEQKINGILYNADGLGYNAEQSIIYLALSQCHLLLSNKDLYQFFNREGEKLAYLSKKDSIKF